MLANPSLVHPTHRTAPHAAAGAWSARTKAELGYLTQTRDDLIHTEPEASHTHTKMNMGTH